jgi:hypothetical protein
LAVVRRSAVQVNASPVVGWNAPKT